MYRMINRSNVAQLPKLVIKSFNLSEKQFNGYSGLLDTVERICKELKSGNESVLLEYSDVKVDF